MPSPTRPVVALLVCAALLACSGSKRRDKAPSESYFDDNPNKPTVGDIPPADMETMIEAHNRKRKLHCADPLEWSGELADAAQAWADKLAKKGCSIDHSKTSYGENLASGTSMGAERAVEVWYEEREHHKFGSKDGTPKAGHFTQLVWRDSKKLGCGTATCSGKRIWVCNYDPAGNEKGDFDDEVLPTSCKSERRPRPGAGDW